MTENRVRIRADLDDKVSGKLDKIRDRFDTLGKSKGAMSILQGVGLAAGAKAFDMLGGAASLAVGFVESSIEAASNLNETITKSEQIFGANSQAVEKWASGMAASFGQSKRAALDTASTFAGLFQTVGLTLDDASGKAQKLTELGSDLASFFNTDVADATAALRSGLAGESEPLRRFNVFLSETAVAAKATELGMKKVNGQFTEGQKVTARYAIILDQTTAAQGDFARTSDGMANQQRVLQARLEDTSAKFGQAMIPVVIEAQQKFLALFDAIDTVNNALAGNTDAIGVTVDSLRDIERNVSGSIPIYGQLVDKIHDWTDSWSGAKKPLEDGAKAMANAELAAKTLNDTIVRDAEPGITESAYSISKSFDAMSGSSKTSTDKIIADFAGMKDALVSDANDIIDKAFDPLMTKDDEMATLSELAAARRVIASKTATKAEKADAHDKLLGLEKDNAEYVLKLAEAGQTGSTAYKKGIAELKTEIKEATGPTKAALQAVLDKILAVERAGKVIPINFILSAEGSGLSPGHKAGGGPASGLTWVGEKGPELVDLPSGSHVYTNPQSIAMAGASSGGSLTVNFNSTWPPTREQAREIARVVDQAQALTFQRAAPTAVRT